MEDDSVNAPNSDVVAGRAASAGRRAWRRGSVLAAGITAAVLGLAGCGTGSPNAGGSTSSQSARSQTLAFSRCVRSHGVPSFPDPGSNGSLPPGAKQIAASSPQFPAANSACVHLLPAGGQPTQAELQQAWSQMRQFTQCMRSHGVPSFPDPTAAAPHPERPVFNLQAAGIDGNSSQIRAKAQECASQLHMSQLPSVSSGS